MPIGEVFRIDRGLVGTLNFDMMAHFQQIFAVAPWGDLHQMNSGSKPKPLADDDGLQDSNFVESVIEGVASVDRPEAADLKKCDNNPTTWKPCIKVPP